MTGTAIVNEIVASNLAQEKALDRERFIATTKQKRQEQKAKEARKIHRDVLWGHMQESMLEILEALERSTNNMELHPDVLVRQLAELNGLVDDSLFVDLNSKQTRDEQFANFVLSFAKELAKERGLVDCVATGEQFDRFAKIAAVETYVRDKRGIGLKLHQGDSLMRRLAMAAF